MDYMVYQLEECPETKRLHNQGYIEFTKQLSFSMVKQLLPDIHFEARKGTQAQAIAYCTKEESRVEEPIVFGVPHSVPGNRAQLSEVQKSATRSRLIKAMHRDEYLDSKAAREIYYEDNGHVLWTVEIRPDVLDGVVNGGLGYCACGSQWQFAGNCCWTQWK